MTRPGSSAGIYIKEVTSFGLSVQPMSFSVLVYAYQRSRGIPSEAFVHGILIGPGNAGRRGLDLSRMPSRLSLADLLRATWKIPPPELFETPRGYPPRSFHRAGVKFPFAEDPRAYDTPRGRRWFAAAVDVGQPTDVKTFDGALSDAKYKKVHRSHLRRKKGTACGAGREVSRRLAPQASLVRGRKVL